MITAVEGKPGQGKSVYLVGQILKFLARGYYVISTISVQTDDPCFEYIETLDEVTGVRLVDILKNKKTRKGREIKGIKVVLDELQVFLNSRRWDSLDLKLQILLQQHRKRGMDILGAMQSIKRADVVFRELVQVFYRVHKIMSFKAFGYGFGFFYLVEYDPDSVESADRGYERIGWPFFFYADPIVMAAYDTTQEITIKDPEGRLQIQQVVFEKKTTVIPRVISKDWQN